MSHSPRNLFFLEKCLILTISFFLPCCISLQVTFIRRPVIRDGHVRLSFISFIIRKRPICLYFFTIIQKQTDFVCSQNYCLFSIYFVRFFTERSFSKIIRPEKLFVDSFFKFFFGKNVCSIKNDIFFWTSPFFTIKFVHSQNFRLFKRTMSISTCNSKKQIRILIRRYYRTLYNISNCVSVYVYGVYFLFVISFEVCKIPCKYLICVVSKQMVSISLCPYPKGCFFISNEI